MADEADLGNARAEEMLQEALERARTAGRLQRYWSGSCFCGEEEGEDAKPFCGIFCRDLYEREEKARRMRGNASSGGEVD